VITDPDEGVAALREIDWGVTSSRTTIHCGGCHGFDGVRDQGAP
jgi:hypothetical protein